ncbi:ATP-binding protein [Bacillus cereus]|uniref:ATP-binding protein n=1 Tax=Bacillus cereus TaxID=1396 RepID=UPI0018F48F6F|nr:ATP-binding protein [Bacillus cereus]MBJ7937858.1 ATP-binding protein [Bacillus cereus]
MALHNAHEGYEYQDLLTSYCILREIINEDLAEFKIDEKMFEEDKFDDLRIFKENKIEQMQIKYSNEDVSYTLSKADLASKGNHKIPLDLLFKSWQETNKILEGENLEYRLCLAWNPPVEEDKLQDVIFENTKIANTFKGTKIYQVDVNKLWPADDMPLASWKRLGKESVNIERKEFEEFCKSLIIEVNFPKASLDIERPGRLEKQVINLVEKLGIGKYPNDNINVKEAILKLAHLVKSVRAKSREEKIKTDYIIKYLNLVTDYGSLNQSIKIDQNKNVKTQSFFNEYFERIKEFNKLVVYGNPGSGKSWFVENFAGYLEEKGYMTVKHYCYTQLGDEDDYKRIKITSLYGNLIADIINKYPSLKQEKLTKYGVDKNEFQHLLSQIQEECVIFIDGLDHIERIYMLNSQKLNRSEISIVEDIADLQIPDNIKIIISTQPIEKESLFEEKGYSIQELKEWNEEQIQVLMNKFNVENIKLETASLSEILLVKSKGNPLYLTYLLEELKKEKFIVKEKIDLLPLYSNNLDEYYKYLLSELEDMLVVNVLCGANFSLSITELKEITGSGKYVEQVIDVLRPVLNHNLATGGLIIYHESFRRHIIERLRNEEVEVKRKIYRDLIEWFEEKGFFNHAKAYRYYLSVLLEINENDKILSLLTNSFVVDSYYHGYPQNLIEDNYKIFLRAATAQKDFEKVVLLSELGNQIASTKTEIEERYELYFQALGYVHGFERLKSSLVYEGKPVFNLEIGLKGCYICSINDVIPNWEAYLFIENQISIENYKYYIRGIFDSNSTELIREAMISISNKGFDDFKGKFIKEYLNHYELKNLEDDIQKLKDPNWSEFIGYYDEKFKTQKVQTAYNGISREIINIKSFHDNEIEVIDGLFNQINLAITNHKFDEINKFVEELQGENWFYNWLIFAIKLKVLKYENNGSLGAELEIKVKECFKILSINTNPFEGKPSVVDLNYVESIIYQSILDGLNLISTKDTWDYIIDMLQKVSDEITYTLQGSFGGPLTSEKLIELLCSNIKPENIDRVIGLINYYQAGKENRVFYSYLAEYGFRVAILYSKTSGFEKAKNEYYKAINYLTAYPFHKDRTLDQLLDSFDSLYKLDSSRANSYIYKVNTLVNTVVSHTDGKETRWYPINWFNKLLKIDYKAALLFLKSQLLKSGPYTILEEMLIELMNNIPDTEIVEKCILFRTFPNKLSEDFLKQYVDLIYKLDELGYSKMKRIAFADLISRFDFNNLESRSISKEVISKIHFLSKKMNYNCRKLESCYIIKNHIIPEKINNRYLKNKIKYRKRFSEMSTNEFLAYFEENILMENDINSFIYFFNSNVYKEDELKFIIKKLLYSNELGLERKTHIRNLKIAFESFLSNELKAYLLTYVFSVEEDGWYKRFFNIERFTEAYELDENIAINTLFECIYEHLEKVGYHNSIGSYLINLLTIVSYDKVVVIRMWETLYNIISLRLPGEVKLDWVEELKNEINMDDGELLQSIVLVRLNHGELERQKVIISGVSHLLENGIDRIKKPLIWFFSNKDKFTNISIILLLQLIFENSKGIEGELNERLSALYPTQNYTINWLIESICGVYEEYKADSNQIEVNYKSTDRQKEMLMFFHNELYVLNQMGLDISQITDKFYLKFENEIRHKIRNLFENRSQRIIIPNIYDKDLVINLLNEELYEYFNKNINLSGFNQNELYPYIAPDIKTIVAYENVFSNRPKDLIRPQEYQRNIFETYIEDKESQWVRLGYWEEEFVKTNRSQFENHEVFQAIVFTEETPSFPFCMSYNKGIWNSEELLQHFNMDIPLCIDMFNDSFMNYKFPWLNSIVIRQLGLQLQNINRGLGAVNEKEEEILLLRSWKTAYLGNDEFKSYELPRLKGNELVIRKDYFEKLCSIVGKEPKRFLIKRS